MTTLARTRAESQFASITKHAVDATEAPALPPENAVKARQTGLNTLHLPSGMQPARANWYVTKRRRVQTPAIAGGIAKP
jgi:hypothetical protein